MIGRGWYSFPGTEIDVEWHFLRLLKNKYILDLNQSDTKMCTLAYSEDPDEMPLNTAFHKGLHCLLRQKLSSENEIQFNLEIITCNPLIYTMDHPKFIVSNQKEEPIST